MEDESMYDDLNLDEEEEKYGIAADDDDDDSDDSDGASEGTPAGTRILHITHFFLDVPPPRTPKKHDDSTPSKRTESPILKKAAVTLQLRSKP
jgi:CCR4-NOT transcription complex subunit 3